MLLRKIYPLKSGLGTVANSRLLRRLDRNPSGNFIARSGRFKLVVPQDDYVGRSIKYFGDLDKKVTWVVNNVLQSGDTALDIGANLGLVSFKMLERVGPSGKVIAFEPQSRMTDFITQSIAQNNIKNLHLQKAGLADAPAMLQLSIPQDNAGAASFVSEGGGRVEEVPVTTLDDFHQSNGLDGVRLIKIDVEGYESRVFKGGKAFLTSVKPDIIIFEENQRTGEVPDSVLIIQSYGYDVFSMPKAWFTITLEPFQPDADGHDFVAIHKDAPTALRRKLGVA